MSFSPTQFRELVEYCLTAIGLYSPKAVELLVLTAAQESHLGKYLKQMKGPACGVYQIEPATHKDLRRWLLNTKPALLSKIHALCFGKSIVLSDEDRDYNIDMRYNLMYATCMARVFYLRVPSDIPETLQGWAEYWKKHYNTSLGKGTVEEAIANYKAYSR